MDESLEEEVETAREYLRVEGKGKVGYIPFEEVEEPLKIKPLKSLTMNEDDTWQDKVLRMNQHSWRLPFSLCLHIVSFPVPGSSFNPTPCN